MTPSGIRLVTFWLVAQCLKSKSLLLYHIEVCGHCNAKISTNGCYGVKRVPFSDRWLWNGYVHDIEVYSMQILSAVLSVLDNVLETLHFHYQMVSNFFSFCSTSILPLVGHCQEILSLTVFKRIQHCIIIIRMWDEVMTCL